eukprot:snap_masked-scaffold_43-processed-gene-1.104-mRNA-1 protein AED:1.00 eAED:1.00 QI:0/-1/0/0/-1/1/1/0/1126
MDPLNFNAVDTQINDVESWKTVVAPMLMNLSDIQSLVQNIQLLDQAYVTSSILLQKLQKRYYQLKVDQNNSMSSQLKHTLIQIIVSFAEFDTPTLREHPLFSKLCQSLAVLVIHENKYSPENQVEQLISGLSTTLDKCYALFHILSHLIDESHVESRTRADPKLKETILGQIAAKGDALLSGLIAYLKEKNSKPKEVKIILNTLLKFLNADICSFRSLDSNMLQYLFNTANPNLKHNCFEYAIEVLSSGLYQVQRSIQQAEIEAIQEETKQVKKLKSSKTKKSKKGKRRQRRNALLKRQEELKKKLDKKTKQDKEKRRVANKQLADMLLKYSEPLFQVVMPSNTSVDVEVSSLADFLSCLLSFCSELFVTGEESVLDEAGISYIETQTILSEQDMSCLQIALDFLNHRNTDVVLSFINFWSDFSLLCKRTIVVENIKTKISKKDIFTKVIEKLIEKIMYPNFAQNSSITSFGKFESKEEFSEFRTDVRETFRDLTLHAIGLKMMMGLIQPGFNHFVTSNNALQWTQLESLLFSLEAVSGLAYSKATSKNAPLNAETKNALNKLLSDIPLLIGKVPHPAIFLGCIKCYTGFTQYMFHEKRIDNSSLNSIFNLSLYGLLFLEEDNSDNPLLEVDFSVQDDQKPEITIHCSCILLKGILKEIVENKHIISSEALNILENSLFKGIYSSSLATSENSKSREYLIEALFLTIYLKYKHETYPGFKQLVLSLIQTLNNKSTTQLYSNESNIERSTKLVNTIGINFSMSALENLCQESTVNGSGEQHKLSLLETCFKSSKMYLDPRSNGVPHSIRFLSEHCAQFRALLQGQEILGFQLLLILLRETKLLNYNQCKSEVDSFCSFLLHVCLTSLQLGSHTQQKSKTISLKVLRSLIEASKLVKPNTVLQVPLSEELAIKILPLLSFIETIYSQYSGYQGQLNTFLTTPGTDLHLKRATFDTKFMKNMFSLLLSVCDSSLPKNSFILLKDLILQTMSVSLKVLSLHEKLQYSDSEILTLCLDFNTIYTQFTSYFTFDEQKSFGYLKGAISFAECVILGVAGSLPDSCHIKAAEALFEYQKLGGSLFIHILNEALQSRLRNNERKAVQFMQNIRKNKGNMLLKKFKSYFKQLHSVR